MKSLGKKANPGEKKGVLLENKKKKSGGGTLLPYICDTFLILVTIGSYNTIVVPLCHCSCKLQA